MSAVAFKLVAKELYSYRWIIAAAIVAGLFSLVIANTGEMAFNIGALAWLTTIIASGVMLPLYGIHQERKDRTLLFALSLPISPLGYSRAKMAGILLSFLALWSALTIGAATLVLASRGIPDGLLPYVLMLSSYLLVNFSLVMCCAFLSTSEIAISAAIILTNMGVTVFMMLVVRAPAIAQHMTAEAPVWNSTFFLILGGEAAAIAIALSLPLIAISRRRDFI